MAIVYAHRKATDDSVFYIGIGNSYKRAERCANRNTHWTRVYNKYGRTIQIIEDDIPVEQARELEIFLISEIGISNLCNQTLGGEGAFGLKHTEETKKKISEANKGSVISKETRKKLSESLMGHTVSDETRAKISKANKGKNVIGRKHTAETIAKMREIKKDSRLSKEALQKSVANRRKNGIKVKELTTNETYPLYDIYNILGIHIAVVRKSYENNIPISRGKFKGFQFKKIKNYETEFI